MPMEPLTAEEIADFRAYLARCKVPVQAGDALPPDWRDLMDASWEIRFFNALPRLLDEAEAARETEPLAETLSSIERRLDGIDEVLGEIRQKLSRM